MLQITFAQRRDCERTERRELEAAQLAEFNSLVQQILPLNEFYAEKFARARLPVQSWDEFRDLPFTTKHELERDSLGYAANRSYPLEQYVRFHRTSGTRGRPLVILDTAEDWQWWVETWQFVLDAAEMAAADRVLMAFSFGPFIGFWTAHDAAIARGALVIPGGGLSSLARLEMIRQHHVSVLFCTPSYALHLVEVAQQNQINPASLGIRRIIVAGEPGGSMPAIRDRIERSWNCQVIDHAGATEVGPWGYADEARRGLRIVETEFIAEFYSVETNEPAGPDELAELVLTTLGRAGCPVFRYRTGDLVRPYWPAGEANQFVLLRGGVLGRVDDMLIVRGVNVFPTAVEQILREFPEIEEYRITASRISELDALTIEIEDRLIAPERVAKELQLRLGLRTEVRCVPLGTLPRFEGKGKRFIDARS